MGDRRGRGLVYAWMLTLFVIWSNSFHSISYFRQQAHVSAGDLVTLRFGPLVPFCLVFCLLHRRALLRMIRQDGLRLLLAALLAVPGYNLPLNWGQGRVPPATASLLIATNPVFIYLLALAFLGERARWAKVGGLAISFAGVYGLLALQHGQFGNTYLGYALVVLISPIAWSLATVIGKPATGRHDPLLFTFAATGLGSVPYMVGLIAGTGDTHTAIATMTPTGWIALAHLSLLCTIAGYAIWFWALKHLPASSVGAFVFLNPPLTLAFGIVWGTEVFHWSTVVFGLVTLLGVALSAGILAPRR